MEVTKAAGFDQLLGKFVNDEAQILAKPNSELCNLSVALRCKIADACKLHGIKPLFKKP